ncbi:hypothetical protein FQR65_LT19718 [Abscondita terminalis]|nr:hypothetical protein FQR65_LT19718 [Abscondita terminalis]
MPGSPGNLRRCRSDIGPTLASKHRAYATMRCTLIKLRAPEHPIRGCGSDQQFLSARVLRVGAIEHRHIGVATTRTVQILDLLRHGSGLHHAAIPGEADDLLTVARRREEIFSCRSKLVANYGVRCQKNVLVERGGDIWVRTKQLHRLPDQIIEMSKRWRAAIPADIARKSRRRAARAGRSRSSSPDSLRPRSARSSGARSCPNLPDSAPTPSCRVIDREAADIPKPLPTHGARIAHDAE